MRDSSQLLPFGFARSLSNRINPIHFARTRKKGQTTGLEGKRFSHLVSCRVLGSARFLDLTIDRIQERSHTDLKYLTEFVEIRGSGYFP